MKLNQLIRWFIPIILILLGLPYFLSPYMLMVCYLSFIWLVLAANFDILDGFMGYIHLAQGVYFGVGAYVATLLLGMPYIQSLGMLSIPVVTLAAVIGAGIVGFFIALLIFRLKGLYFAVTTLVLIFLLQIIILNLSQITGGSYGAFVPNQFYISTFNAYYLALILAVISIGINYHLSNSKIGLAFQSIREDEGAAASIGLKVARVKRVAYVLSTLPSAAAGVVFALNSGFIDPNIALGVERSLIPPIMAMLGGSGHFLGPVVGMIIIRFIDVLFYSYVTLPVSSMLLFGVVLMLVALFIPEGLLRAPFVKRIRQRFSKKNDEAS